MAMCRLASSATVAASGIAGWTETLSWLAGSSLRSVTVTTHAQLDWLKSTNLCWSLRCGSVSCSPVSVLRRDYEVQIISGACSSILIIQ